MSRNIIFGFLLILFYQRTNAKLCDLKKWYKNLQNDNIIVSNLNIEQEELIEKIEKKIRNSKFSGNGKINCDILEEYELILSADPNRHKRKAASKIKSFDKNTDKILNDVKHKRKLNENADDQDIVIRKGKKDTSSKKKEISKEDDYKNSDTKDQALKKDDEKSDVQNKIHSIKKDGKSQEAIIEEQHEYDPTESDVDETELLEEELQASPENVKGDTFGNEEKKQTMNQSHDDGASLYQSKGHKVKSKLQKINQICSKYTNKCSGLCYYSYQNQQSLLQYPGLHSQNKTQNEFHSENHLPKEGETIQESSKSSDNDIKAVERSLDESDSDRTSGGNSGTAVKINTDKIPGDRDNVDKQAEVYKDSEEKLSVQMDGMQLKEIKSDSDNNNDKGETRDSKASDQPNLNLDNIDVLIQQRAAEYSTKISQLEILLMKLENKFLNQQLHKQNNSNSFSKLEFQIVKLENELLKLNQSYHKLSSENEILKNQERLRSKSYAALPEGNTTKHTELITQQQVQISQLTDWLTNQTTNLNQLKDKSDSLAAQNQALYQIVMNQTALVSNIMQKVQDLSDENLSYRKETQDLKSKINAHDASVKILEKLESLGSKRDTIDTSQKQKQKQFHFLPDAPDASINRHLWKCNGLLSPQICYKYSILLSPCPPFSTVYWRKCPKFIYEKTASFFVEFTKEFPNGTEGVKLTHTKDRIPQKPDGPNVRYGKKPALEIEFTNDFQNGTEAAKLKDNKHNIPAKPYDPKVRSGKKPTPEAADDQSKEDKKSQENMQDRSFITQEDKNDEDKREQILVKDDEDDKVDTGRPIKYKSSSLKKPKDCYEVYQRGSSRNGVYKIFLPGLKYYVDVYCDMKNGGWTLIQRRNSGEIDFFKDWKSYKEGFGANTEEHYLGNDYIHFLTNQGHYSLHVELVNWKKEKRQAIYKDFWIDEEADGFKLHIEGYDGDAGDGLSKHNGMKFSTHDVDNDKVIKEFGGSCAKRFHGAGWYYKCYSSNLNGQYYDNGVVPPKKFDGVAWKPWTGPSYSLKEVVLKVRPKDVL